MAGLLFILLLVLFIYLFVKFIKWVTSPVVYHTYVEKKPIKKKRK